MKRLAGAVLVALLMVPLPAAAAPRAPEPSGGGDGKLDSYTAVVGADVADALRREDFSVVALRGTDQPGSVEVELILTDGQAETLRKAGLELNETGAGDEVARAQAAGGVFRQYSGPGGIEEELRQIAAANPRLVKLVTIGHSIQGQPILALKVTDNARAVRDGSRPSVLYTGTQHAREWITPEVNRRLLHYVIDQSATDPSIRALLRTTELWFVTVLNPDGYDFTFTEGNRLWRKNLRDVNGDGQITADADGVDPNRNYPTKWGYDNEGSSPNPSSETYRGAGPASEPETQALDGLMRRLRPRFLVNYHSAAELLLYGVGWQVSTPSPDDVIYEALAGDDRNPAVPGYDPDISAELYTTNGETTEHAQTAYGTLGFTPELSTCQTVSPDPDSCESVFSFPDDEALIQAEFEKNIPFALDVARSAVNPYEPVSHLGNVAPDYRIDAFDVSTGSPQTVQASVSRQIPRVVVEYSINGGPVKRVTARDWAGGERYGDGNDNYYRRVRGVVTGAVPGDSVQVWFASATGGSRSEPFTYQVRSDTNAAVLVIANEDITGVTPEQNVSELKYLDYYLSALDANGVAADVWDLDTEQRAPHPLGVLSHYRTVLWYTGDDIITQDPSDRDVLFPDSELGVDDIMQFTEINVRDFVNEGGKIFKTGKFAGYFGQFALVTGGLFYATNGRLDTSCRVSPGGSIFSECLVYSDDFHQYWLGAYQRQGIDAPQTVDGTAGPLAGQTLPISGGDGANNQDHAGEWVLTSDVLPPDQFPQFTSTTIGDYAQTGQEPFQPLTGAFYTGAVHSDNAYMRLARTIDLSAVTAAEQPQLSFQLSYETEVGYDFVIVEAHQVGTDAWTTLPDLNGGTTQGNLGAGTACGDGLWQGLHPFLDHYTTFAANNCAPTGTTGAWNAFNGSSGGYQEARFDLSAYAGQSVEVSISYVSDVGVGGVGAFVDDTAITIGGTVVDENGFEAGLDPWAVPGPPEGSPGNATDWARAQRGELVPLTFAAIQTTDSVLLGFGFEAISTAAQRNDIMRRVLAALSG